MEHVLCGRALRRWVLLLAGLGVQLAVVDAGPTRRVKYSVQTRIIAVGRSWTMPVVREVVSVVREALVDVSSGRPRIVGHVSQKLVSASPAPAPPAPETTFVDGGLLLPPLSDPVQPKALRAHFPVIGTPVAELPVVVFRKPAEGRSEAFRVIATGSVDVPGARLHVTLVREWIVGRDGIARRIESTMQMSGPSGTDIALITERLLQ